MYIEYINKIDGCYFVPSRGAEYCDDHVCLSVCISTIISPELHVRSLSSFFVYATYVRVSVLLWRCCDMLRTSGIMDDVMFVDNGQEWASGNAVKR